MNLPLSPVQHENKHLIHSQAYCTSSKIQAKLIGMQKLRLKSTSILNTKTYQKIQFLCILFEKIIYYVNMYLTPKILQKKF